MTDEMFKQYDEYHANGFICIRGLFEQKDLDDINNNVNRYVRDAEVGVSFEKDGSLRGVHGMHLYCPYFLSLARNDTFLNYAAKLLNGEPYIHQSKINLKVAINGKDWPWHQDFIFWNVLDHIPTPNMLSIAILLDDVDYLSGPLWFIPKSHNLGELSKSLPGIDPTSHSWESDVSEALSYQVPNDICKGLQLQNGVFPFVGKAGDVVIFHSRLIHGSTNNMSASDRKLILFTYNEVSNVGVKRSSRPDFLCSYP
jgi:ectoine hydroxylase